MKLYGLIGAPLSHSFSKNYFTEKFAREGISDARYELFPLQDLSGFPELISAHPDLCGLNVTIPHKQDIIPFLDELDISAKEIGAVNCIRINGDSQKPFLTGYNTDAEGFRQSIKPFLESKHERALILGTGGASRAVAFVLNNIGIDCYFVTRKKRDSVESNLFDYSELNEHVMKAFRLIVNTTPVGMYPDTDSFPEIPYSFLTGDHLLYDLIYNPEETAFLRKGKANGAAAVNGLSMLHLQAEAAWKVWNS